MIRAVLLALSFGLCASGASACRLALVLAMDVSSSVNAQEDRLQRGGLAAALRAPRVRAAFFASEEPVALAVFEWSGRYNQHILQDWIVVENQGVLDSVVARIAGSDRSQADYPTALGHGLGFAATLLQRAPSCDARTVDVSGDGPNNDGFAPLDDYGAFPFDAVTVNGLVIDVPEGIADTDGWVNLADYYLRNVIRGPGAFIEVADGFEDFARAMEVKLIRELGVKIIGEAPGRQWTEAG